MVIHFTGSEFFHGVFIDSFCAVRNDLRGCFLGL